MNRSMMVSIKAIFQQHWILICTLIVAQILAVLSLRSLLIIDPFAERSAIPERTLLVATVALIFCYALFVLFLGLIFNSGSRSSWLFQLPISERAFLIVPVSLIFIYGAILRFTVPWGVFTSGIEMVLFGAPILCFLILKNSRNLTIGVAKAGVFALVLFFFWISFLLEWSARLELWRVDLAYLCAFMLLSIIFERRQKGLVLCASLMIAIINGWNIIHIQIFPPANFSDAVYRMAFVNSEKTRNDFKRFALGQDGWESVQNYSLPEFIRAKAQLEADEVLESHALIEYFKNIRSNEERWMLKPTNDDWQRRLSVFPQPSLLSGSMSDEPIGYALPRAELTEFLYQNWQDSKVFCAALPFEKSKRYLKAIFESECGYRRLSGSPIWSSYSLGNEGDFEQALDRYLLSSDQRVAPKVKRFLNFVVFDTYLLRRQMRDHFQDLLQKGKFGEQDLAKLKTVLRAREEEFLNPLRGTPVEFRREVMRQTGLGGSSADAGSLYLFEKLKGSIWIYAATKEMKELSLSQLFQYWISDLLDQNSGKYNYWIRKTLLDDSNWPQIEKILATPKK